MEDLLGTSGLENEDSFSFLCSSFDVARSKGMDESAQTDYLIAKLSDFRSKYEYNGFVFADHLDDMEKKHADEMMAKTTEFEETLKQLQDAVSVCSQHLRAKDAENDALSEANNIYKMFLISVRKQIDSLLDQANQNTSCQMPDEIVNIDSGSEDEVCDQEMEEVQSQAEVHVQPNVNEQAANGDKDAEMVQHDSIGYENDVTVVANDANKENVRPQSTPIAKVDAPADSPKVTASSTQTPTVVSSDSNALVAAESTSASVVAPNPPAPAEEAVLVKEEDNQSHAKVPSNANVQLKMYLCPFCEDEEIFSGKEELNAHLKEVHRMKKSKKTEKNDKPGKLVRAPSLTKRKYVFEEMSDDHDEEATEDDVIKTLPQKRVLVWANPMSHAVKRYKKSATKFISKKE